MVSCIPCSSHRGGRGQGRAKEGDRNARGTWAGTCGDLEGRHSAEGRGVLGEERLEARGEVT